MLHGVFRKVRQRRVGGVLENRESIGILHILVGIDQPTNQFVVAVGGEAVLLVVIARNGLGVQAVQAQHFFTCWLVPSDGIHARERRNPLAECAAGSKSVFVFAPFVVRIVVIPAAQVVARGGLAAHLTERLQQAVLA